MKNFFRKLSLVFASGAFGALVNSTVLWLFGRAGITAELGVKLAPSFTPAWLYPRSFGAESGESFFFSLSPRTGPFSRD